MSFYQTVSPQLAVEPINLLLHTLLNLYLSDSYCLTFVLEKPFNFNINGSFTQISPDNGTVGNLTDQLLEASEKGCSDYIVYMSDPQKFMAAFDQVSRRGWIRRSDRKIIVLPYSAEENYVNESLILLSMKESTFVANLLVILPNKKAATECEVYDLITHEFVSLELDRPLYLDQWDSCTRKFVNNVNLFPHNMTNLNGRLVRLSCFTYEPYALIDLDPAVSPSRMDGLEVRIVEEFCRWVNCTVVIVPVTDLWGEVFDNGTGTGILGEVFEDRADMGICALYSWYDEYVHLDFSDATVRAGVTCVAPSPRLIVSWEMPLLPFSWFMWFLVVITFVISSFGLILSKGSNKGVFLNIFAIMLAQSQDPETEWRNRSITGWLVSASLVLTSAYGAGLASTFTVPKYTDPIDTARDLVNRDIIWGANCENWIFSLELSTDPLVRQLVNQYRIYTDEELSLKSYTRSMAYVLEKLPGAHYAVPDFLEKEALRDYKVMMEDLYYAECVIMMKKSSVYTGKLSELIGRLQQSGLLLAWETQVALKYLNFEVQQGLQLANYKNDGDSVAALSLKHVVGVYILFFLGVVLASLVFMGEYVSGKFAKRAILRNMDSKLNNI